MREHCFGLSDEDSDEMCCVINFYIHSVAIPCDLHYARFFPAKLLKRVSNFIMGTILIAHGGYN